MEEVRGTFIMLTDKPAKRLSGRSRRRWEDNIGMDLKEIGIGLIGLRIGITGEHFRIRY